jgi:hypothetical protein
MNNFWNDLESQKTISVNGNDMLLAVYNLIILRGQLRLYTQTGIKPNGSWRVKDVNQYFTLPTRQTARVTLQYVNYYYENIIAN